MPNIGILSFHKLEIKSGTLILDFFPKKRQPHTYSETGHWIYDPVTLINSKLCQQYRFTQWKLDTGHIGL